MKAHNKVTIERCQKIKGKPRVLLFETDQATFKRLNLVIKKTGLTKRDVIETGLKWVLATILK